MIKLLSTVLLFSLTSVALAENLKCKESFDIFNQQIAREEKVLLSGSVEEIQAYYKDANYAELLKPKHPGKVYTEYDGWIDEEEYLFNIAEQAEVAKDANLKYISHKFLEPKANFISSVGEVCVVPYDSKVMFFNKKMTASGDTIYVRNLKDNTWRSFVYFGVENANDFKEFFPDFPKNIKLLPELMNGKNYADSVDEIGVLMIESLGIKIDEEVKQELQKQTDVYRERLKKNGYL